ncbi:MAG: type IX secretion system sortase PorU, partial [Bergeyella zoohelcum]|nr:type IX secretion system sortase PorU [Bergeyella zoohelcum]
QKNKTFSTNNTINTENPLKSGTFYKIKIDQSGVFKITKKFLQDNGINVANINPKNFRIYGNGGLVLPEDNRDFRYPTLQENAIQVVGEEDGVWNDSDYALFYAQGANGFNLYGNTNGNTRKDNRTDRSRHTINIYEDASYYFINFDLGEGKRITSKNTALPEGDLFTRYDDYQFINEEKNNLIKLGRVWVGDAFTNDIAVKFTTKTPLRSDDIVNYRTSFVGYKVDKNSLSLSINGQAKGTTILSDGYRKSNYFTGSLSNLTGNEVSFNFSPNISANPAGTFHLDYVEIMYPQDLVFNGSQMNFRSYEITENDNETYGFSMANASSVEQIWEVSDITNVYRMTNKSADNTTFNFGYEANSAQFNNEFVAFNHSAAYTPTFVGRIDNQDISSLQNIDYLVITRQDMMSEAARLTSYHETKNGFRTAIVSTEQIYNEFSSGKKDITAIRDFISHLKNNRGGLRYVLILGDTSYDYKDKTTGNDNIVPSYQSEESGNYSTSFVTDDYFVMTNPQTTSSIVSNLPTLPIGRLPASNLTEAKLLIDKTLAYYNALPNQSSPFGAWRMNLDFVADDNNEGGTPFHTIMNNAIAENFETGTERKEYHTRKLYMDAYQAETTAGGQRFPQINQSIANAVGNSLYLFYFGHGGINGWAQERILTLDEIQKFNNYSSIFSRFPLVSTITCEFTLWDEPLVQSAGEQVIKQKNGGAATMITSSREIGVTYGKDMTDIFTKNIFALQNNDFATMGDAFLNAKKEKGTHSDHLRVNYLGDPAMKLSRPKPLLTIDNVQTPVAGKIRALDFVKIEGSVLKEDGSVNTDFNGNVSINIFDKKLTKSTLNND